MHEKVDLFIITGNFGTGKTTTGSKIEQQFQAPRSEPDLMRRELGITEYRREDNFYIRQKMWAKIMNLLSEGGVATLCIPHVAKKGRERSYAMLQQMSLEIGRTLQAILIRCECSEVLAKERMRQRTMQEGYSYPPKDPEQYNKKKIFDQPIDREEISQNPNISFIIFDTEHNVLRVLAGQSNHSDTLIVLNDVLTKKIDELQINVA